MVFDVRQASIPGEQREAELEQALAREMKISRALREVGSALGTTLELDDLLELILSRVTELLEADRATLYLLDDSKGELVSRLVLGGQARSIRLKLGHGIAGRVAQTGRPIRVRDAYQDERFESDWDTLTGYRTTSMLVVPLKNHLGRTIGVIQALNKKQDLVEFTDEDEAILSALSTQAAVAIDNSRLFLSLIQKNKQLLDTKEQLERRLSDLELLFDLEQATARSPSIDALVTAIASKVTQACGARAAAVLVAEEDSGDLVQHLFDAEKPDELLHFGIKAGEGFLGACMSDDELIVIEDAVEDPRYSSRVEGGFPFEVTSVLAVPLHGSEGMVGALGLFSKSERRAFNEEDIDLVRLVSANASTALRLYQASETRERTERLTTIGQLLSQVIHDFKTPMTVISGYVQLMQDADDQKVRSEYTEEILRQFDALTAMQREVLEFARGEKSIFVRRVYLKRFFFELARGLKQELEQKPVELEVDIDNKVVARFDEARIARAIHNLARNAVEAMGSQGGRLVLRAYRDGGELVIQVADTGPGIPKEVEGRLFQSFVTAKKEGGTGLGLAIVKKIVEEHEGTVSVVSTNAGATFELRLPQPEPRVPRARPTAELEHGSSPQ